MHHWGRDGFPFLLLRCWSPYVLPPMLDLVPCSDSGACGGLSKAVREDWWEYRTGIMGTATSSSVAIERATVPAAMPSLQVLRQLRSLVANHPSLARS